MLSVLVSERGGRAYQSSFPFLLNFGMAHDPSDPIDPHLFIKDVEAWLEYRRDWHYRHAANRFNRRFDPDVEAYVCALRLVNFAQQGDPTQLNYELRDKSPRLKAAHSYAQARKAAA